jgi:hypothetical protein
MPHMSRSRGRGSDRDLLARVWRCWLDAGRRITADEWETPSGLGDWTVRELYAHVGKGVHTLADLRSQPPVHGEPELPDAAAYFAALRPLGTAGAEQVARAAVQWAADREKDVLIEDFDGPAVAALAGVVDHQVVRSIAGPIRMAEFVVTRIVEGTVHLLDLGHTPPADAMDRVVDVLADLSPPADFIRLATGRPAAAIFPVLS